MSSSSENCDDKIPASPKRSMKKESSSSQSAPHSQADSPSEMSPKQAVSRCIHLLKRARNDTEKFAALLMITKLVKAESIDDKSKAKLFDAIGVDFILKLLRDEPSEDMCPKFMFKSIALTILSCFINTCQKKEIFCGVVPDLLRIITDPLQNEENLTIVRDSFKCLITISLNSNGRKAIIEDEGIAILVELYVQENVLQEMVFDILKIIMSSEGQQAWLEDRESFTKLAVYTCKEFSQTQSERKFELCALLTEMMFSMPDILPNDDGYEWQKQLHQGLADILLSKLSKQQREQGLKLACASLSSLGATWVVAGGSRGHQLLLIMVHLSCIEVRMSLENESFEKAVELASNTTACYNILEHAIKFLVEGALDLEEKQKQQLYTALKGAFNAVLLFLKELNKEKVHTSNMATQLFVCATIRILGAWLAEETAANKPEVYELLPFIIQNCQHNYEWNQKMSPEISRGTCPELPDLFKFLLPSLCHLTAEDEPREILLGLQIDAFLFEYMKSKFEMHKVIRESKNLSSGLYSSDGTSLNNLNDTLVTQCSILMNIVVTSSSEVVMKNLYFDILKYIFIRVNELPTSSETFLPLIGNLCILGLMIIKHHHVNLKNTEYGIFKFIQATVRFLWEAHNVEDSLDYASLVISHKYHPIWDQLMELWYLGMHNITILISVIPWISEFLLECDWPQSTLKALADTKQDGIEVSLKATFEDLLTALVTKSLKAKKELIEGGAKETAMKHELTVLLAALQS